MEDDAKLSHRHPKTLFSRLDQLDFVMKYLEQNQSFERVGGSNNSGGMERRCISLDVALKDTCFKGSLLDRVAALEHRLFQLCLEVDYSGCSSNPSSSAEIRSSPPKQFCRGKPSSSYPTFHYPSHGGITSQISQVQEKKGQIADEQKQKQRSPSKGKLSGKTKTPKHGVGSSKNVNKGIPPPPKWPHLRIFGC